MAIYGKLNLSILIWKIIGGKTFEILDLSIGKEPPNIVAKSKDKSGFLHIQSNNYKWIFHTFLVISELAGPAWLNVVLIATVCSLIATGYDAHAQCLTYFDNLKMHHDAS